MSHKDLMKGALAGVVASTIVTISLPALAGTGVGGIFNLGRTNRVNAPTTLKGAPNDKNLQITNTGSGRGLGITVSAGKAPIVVNPGAGKATNLDADELDGLSSGAFQRVATKALVLTPDPSATSHTLLVLPGLGTLSTSCSTTDANLFFSKASSIAEVDAGSQRLFDPAGNGTTDTVVTMATVALTSDRYTFAPVAGVGSKGRYSIQLSTPAGGGRVYTVTVTLTSQDDNISAGKCAAWAQLD